MHSGRHYPQIKHRWKLPDCTNSHYIPRQGWITTSAVHHGGDHGLMVGASYECADDRTALQEYFPFQRLVFPDTTLDVETWYDGTNELDWRGLWLDQFDEDNVEQLLFWRFDNQFDECSGPYFAVGPFDLSPGPDVCNWTSNFMYPFDWYSFPVGPGWWSASDWLPPIQFPPVTSAKLQKLRPDQERQGRERAHRVRDDLRTRERARRLLSSKL